MNIQIIFEDKNIIIINKPSGLVVHPFDYSTEYTLVDFLHEKYPEIFTIENSVTLQDKRNIPLGGIVHKLDRDTSGVMVIAKNQEVFDELKSQFRNHITKKNYISLVEGIIGSDNFVIDAPLGRGKKEYKQSTNPINPRGELRDAVTDVEVLKRMEKTTLVKLSPKTGRTHQLRAHMSSIGHPIVGDKAYGSKIDSERIMLHAESLEFSIEGKEYSFKVEVPEGFDTFK
ncbi:RluA family pseudouridine synthase [Candidatus Gracilibacteria bacterium]|nr:RluA family pseudouridine synthase [Candidatus Gracilibacteria bacterium]MCF7898493.1 RluA family pseudouridine synthase [Candidatus Paceibacterota bacterium]